MSLSVEHQGRKGFKFENWSQTYSCQPELYFEPETKEDLQKILAHAAKGDKKVRVVGKGHSPSDLACSDDYLVSLAKFSKVVEIDPSACTVTAEGGIILQDLNEVLAKNGLGLSVLGALSDFTLAGTLSAGTHGTGQNYGILSSYILELEMMTADGNILCVSRDSNSELFLAASLGLGALGIILSVKLRCEKAFKLHLTRYPLPLDDVLTNLDVHLQSSDHFRFLWFPHTDGCELWHSRRTQQKVMQSESWFWNYFVGYYLLEFVLWISTFFTWMVPHINRCFYKLLCSRTSDKVGRSDKVFNYECLFKQYVTEWAVPRDQTAVVLKELQAWVDNHKFGAHFPVEVRFVKGDDILLSPAYGRDTCYINIIMYRPYGKHIPHEQYWEAFESIMLEAGGRPHWAKAHNVTLKQFRQMYPEWDKFAQIRRRLDPQGRFLNSYLQRYFGQGAEKTSTQG